MAWARRRRRSMVRWRRARRWIITASLLLVGAGSLGVLGATAMMRHSPAWWRQLHPDDPVTVETARDVEDGLTRVFHADRPVVAVDPGTGRRISEEWAFSLRAADANAWLNTRLPAWLTRSEDLTAWPQEVRQIQVDFRSGRILVGVELSAGEVVRVLSAEVRPEVHADGSLWLPAETVRVGTLPLPARLVLGSARSREDEFVPVSVRRTGESDVLWNALLGTASVADSPTVRLPDGRRIRILGLRAHSGVLEVRCRTEWEGDPVAPDADRANPSPPDAGMDALEPSPRRRAVPAWLREATPPDPVDDGAAPGPHGPMQ